MRIALIILSILALVSMGIISWSILTQEGWKVRMPMLGTTSTTKSNNSNDVNSTDNLALETWKNQVKTEEKLEKLTNMVEELAKKSGTYNDDTRKEENTGSVKEKPAVRPSGKLLALIMPTVTPVLANNEGIFGLFVFDLNVNYSTYKDNAFALTLIPTDISYDVLLDNIKALGGKPYTVNETKNLPFRSFFLNPDKSDTLVRLVIEIENQAIAIEVPKSKFETLKGLLQGKTPPGTSVSISTGSAKTPTIVTPTTKTVR